MKFTSETPRNNITVQGLQFGVPQPYTEGHVLTANEANQLNTVLAENVRNNFAPTVKKAKEEYAKANNMDVEDVTAEHLDAEALAKEFETYISEYEFNTRRVGGGSAGRSPLEIEARKIARERVRAHLQAKGIALSKVPAEKMEEYVAGVAAREDIRKLAEKRLKEMQKLALEDILPEDIAGEPQAEAA